MILREFSCFQFYFMLIECSWSWPVASAKQEIANRFHSTCSSSPWFILILFNPLWHQRNGEGCFWISFLQKKIRFMVSGGPLTRQEKTRCLRMHLVPHKQGAWRAKLQISVLFWPREFFIWSLNQIKIILVHFEWWWWNYWVYFVCFFFFFLKYEAT